MKHLLSCHIRSPKLKERKLIAPDLRAGFAYIIAGVLAEGITEIENSYVIKRGYVGILKKFQKIGVSIEEKQRTLVTSGLCNEKARLGEAKSGLLPD